MVLGIVASALTRDFKLPHFPVALFAKLIDAALHPRQQLFGRRRAEAGSAECLDILALIANLRAQSCDFSSEKIEIHGAAFLGHHEQNKNTIQAATLRGVMRFLPLCVGFRPFGRTSALRMRIEIADKVLDFNQNGMHFTEARSSVR
jgi:hypothetical protein